MAIYLFANPIQRVKLVFLACHMKPNPRPRGHDPLGCDCAISLYTTISCTISVLETSSMQGVGVHTAEGSIGMGTERHGAWGRASLGKGMVPNFSGEP